jgi:hypothetical protein
MRDQQTLQKARRRQQTQIAQQKKAQERATQIQAQQILE